MTKTFHLTVRTLETEVISAEVTSVKVGTEDGPMVIYPGHASLTGSIPFSRLVTRDDSSEKEYLVRNGIVFISLETKSTQILCYSCVETKDIEYKSAREYLDFIEAKLNAGENLNDYQLKYLQNEKIGLVQQMKVMGK